MSYRLIFSESPTTRLHQGSTAFEGNFKCHFFASLQCIYSGFVATEHLLQHKQKPTKCRACSRTTYNTS